MENLTLLPTTRAALQNFLQIWKQDPLAQQTLCIAPQNIFICDPQRPDQITDITIELEEPNDIEQENSFSIEEFIDIELGSNEAKETTREEPEVCIKNTKEIQELLKDLTHYLSRLKVIQTPFLPLLGKNK